MMRAQLAGLNRILCLGAHADDIEIGCGATLLTLIERFPDVHIDWVVLSSGALRAAEARAAAVHLLGSTSSNVRIEEFRNGYFPAVAGNIKDYFETLKGLEPPDLIFTHHLQDRHQDHRVVGELTWNTFRNHWIMEYEVPKYEGDLGAPNVFVPVSASASQRKIDVLLECFPSQLTKRWFTAGTFEALMRLRGVECQADRAEAFHVRKTVI